MSIITLIFLLFCGHAVADFALQTEWIAINKNRHAREKYSSDQQNKMEIVWPWLLTAHSFIHGLMVFLVTQKISLGIAEIIVHWITDYGKSEKWYGFHADQIIHLVTKLVWVFLIYQNYV